MATPNLGLETFNTASGSATTFLQFRLAIADASSNMSKIDDFAGGVSASIVNMEAGIIKNVIGNLASPNYFVGTSDLESYAVGGFINVILDTDVAGDTQININSIGNTYLKKVDTSGSVVALASGDVIKNTYYLFTYDGTQYVLVSGGAGGTSASGISAISGSSVMSDTTGSVVKHNVSGVTSGSYNAVEVDEYGHVTSGSVVSSGGGSIAYVEIVSSASAPEIFTISDGAFDYSHGGLTVVRANTSYAPLPSSGYIYNDTGSCGFLRYDYNGFYLEATNVFNVNTTKSLDSYLFKYNEYENNLYLVGVSRNTGLSGNVTFYSASVAGGDANTYNYISLECGLITAWTQT